MYEDFGQVEVKDICNGDHFAGFILFCIQFANDGNSSDLKLSSPALTKSMAQGQRAQLGSTTKFTKDSKCNSLIVI